MRKKTSLLRTKKMRTSNRATKRVAYLGLGSNSGDRLAHLQSAIDLIKGIDGIDEVESSAVYETEPVGEVLDQPEFLNQVVRAEVTTGPIELLGHCKQIERDLERAVTARHGPRTIDLDILLLGDLKGTFTDEDAPAERRTVKLPHPMILQRRFVLQPIVEMDPELRHPSGVLLRDALAELGTDQRVEKLIDSAYTQ